MTVSSLVRGVAWHPDPTVIERARLTEFMRRHRLNSFDDLYHRSVNDVAWFTESVLRFLEIPFDAEYTEIIDLSRGPAWPAWCVGGKLNISRACLDRHLGTPTESAAAIIWEGEEGTVRTVTYAELQREVERCAAGLRAYGVRPGDTIAIYLPMVPETAIALFAIARIGAVAVPLFSGYGAGAIAARLSDVGAKLLFTSDGFPRRGRTVRAKDTADEALARAPVQHVVVVQRLGIPVDMEPGRDVWWTDLMEAGAASAPEARVAEATATEDPLIVIYSSGTTGKPKGILHTHCGFPIKAAQDMAFGTDVGLGTRIAWVTDLGWMMGPWLLYGSAILGATAVLYDGAPDFPRIDRLWRLCASHGVEVVGISPSLVRSLMTHGSEHVSAHDLSRLRIIASTGEPWNDDAWWWCFEAVGGGRLPIVNYSGGTEISGGILMGNPLLPLKPCSFPAPCPGIAADVVDDHGRTVRDEVGELVIRKPWIGMARGFWKDPDRYLETYWSRLPGMWLHGDWARVDGDGFWYILGRSDDTLKVAGKRVGPAEVESAVADHHQIAAAAAVGVPDPIKGSSIIVFCVPKDNVEDENVLAAELQDRVDAELGRPLRPDRILFVRALPRTRNAKVMRRVIRAAYLQQDPGDLSALENPESVDMIRALPGGTPA